jgi:gamma-glutamyltranspeptidase / glutathione hydrolase
VSAFERPSGVATQSRSVVLARQGIVATSHPLAAQTGLDVLKAGGSAADAAVAAAAMIGVVEPMSCGIGGDLFLIYWDQKTEKLYGLDASGRSPRSLTREVFRERNLDLIPVDGPLSWSVPGCVSGWSALQQRFGTRSFADNLAPAIATAEEGFPVSELIAESWRQHEPQLQAWPDSAATYLIDGRRAPRFGEIFRNPRLAASYREIARHGEDGFYQGEIARKIAAFSRENGGYLTEEDFARHEANWIDPVSTNYRGYDVWELPPPGQGISALQMLNLLEPHDVASMGHGSPAFVHLFTEAKKLAFADRARFYADPSMAEVPTERLISKEYAAERAKRLSLERAAEDVPHGDPRLVHGDTIYLTVVDKDRNCCSLIQSIYYNFGSQVTPGDVGFVMQNRGALFTLDESHPNRLEPGKRPFHTIIPAMVTHEGRPWLCFGVMGGDMQPQGHVQVLCNLIDFGMNLQAAGDAARVRHDGSATPRGEPSQGVGTLFVEAGIPDSTVRELTERGHVVKRERGSYGGYQAIMLDHEQGVLHGASEVRKDGAAVGY